MVADPLAFGSTRQVDVTCEHVPRLPVTPMIVAVAGVPASIVAGGAAALVGLLPVISWAAPQRPRVIVATFSLRLVARVVEVSGIEIHDTPLSMDRTIATFGTRIPGDKLVTIVRGFGSAAVAAHVENVNENGLGRGWVASG